MLPKVQAAVKFAESKPGRTALITLLEKAKDGIAGKDRHPDPPVSFFMHRFTGGSKFLEGDYRP